MFLLSILVLNLLSIYALDVSWVPSDPDGPLPLSSKYRESLNELCSIIKSGEKLPPDVSSKRATIEKMCRKLAGSTGRGEEYNSKLIYGLLAIAIAYWFYPQVRQHWNSFWTLRNIKKVSISVAKDNVSQEEMRNARLRKLASNNQTEN